MRPEIKFFNRRFQQDLIKEFYCESGLAPKRFNFYIPFSIQILIL